jgi:hypothetical protein
MLSLVAFANRTRGLFEECDPLATQGAPPHP